MKDLLLAKKPLKVTIIGLGSVGGLIGARLAMTGHEVSAIARGETLSKVRENGLSIFEPSDIDNQGKHYFAPIKVVENSRDLPPQDVIIISVKGPALEEAIKHVPPILSDETIVISAMNGVPWWFFERPDFPLYGHQLETIDPNGTILSTIPAKHVIGGVVMWASSCPEPGVVKLNLGNKFTIGEALGGESFRLNEIAKIFEEASFDVTTTPSIHKEVWYKLWGNMTANPISAMTGATYDLLIADPLVMRFAYDCMEEAALIGKLIGCPIDQSGEKLMVEAGHRLGAFKTSMLQDAEHGRKIELDELIGAVREIGAKVKIPTPKIDALYGLVRLFGQMKGLYS